MRECDTRKLSAAEELERLRPQVYDAEMRALRHKALRLILDCTGVMNETQLAAIAEIKLRYKAVQEFYGPECKHRDVANRDRVEMAHRYAVAHLITSGAAEAEAYNSVAGKVICYAQWLENKETTQEVT